jgi:intein/homing endonuclease
LSKRSPLIYLASKDHKKYPELEKMAYSFRVIRRILTDYTYEGFKENFLPKDLFLDDSSSIDEDRMIEIRAICV